MTMEVFSPEVDALLISYQSKRVMQRFVDLEKDKEIIKRAMEEIKECASTADKNRDTIDLCIKLRGRNFYHENIFFKRCVEKMADLSLIG